MNKPTLAVALLCTVSAGFGFMAASAEIGYTVLAANGVRDIAIQAMTDQGEALRRCKAALPPAKKPTVFHPRPKRLEL